jgi:glycosyltransferase involved in cell wall biosynthesis
VIASDRAPVRALVEPDVSGLLVPPGDVEAWVEALRRASMSPDARRRWGRKAREIALRRLAWPQVARLFESLLLAERAKPLPAEAELERGVEESALEAERA